MNGTTPFVDGARILALTSGVRETNTLARLRGCADRKAIRQEEAAAWCDAYAFVLLQRMRTHQAQQRAGRLPADNRLDPDDLNELDRRILKEAFRQARKLQSRLKLDYQLSL
jgi:CBS domain-containing protein